MQIKTGMCISGIIMETGSNKTTGRHPLDKLKDLNNRPRGHNNNPKDLNLNVIITHEAGAVPITRIFRITVLQQVAEPEGALLPEEV
jgi:hypothetical protein